MKVVFLEEVFGTAVPGEVKDVKGGFARNYLLPRKLAVPATKDAMQRAEALSKREERRQAALDADAQKVVQRLEGQKVVVRARVGEQGRLYGSVTAAEIASRLEELIGGEVDRRRVSLAQPIREIGTHSATVRLTRNVSHTIEVEVEAEDSTRRRTTVSASPLPPIIPDAEEVEPEAVEDEDEEVYEEDEA